LIEENSAITADKPRQRPRTTLNERQPAMIDLDEKTAKHLIKIINHIEADELRNYEECSKQEKKNHIYKSIMAVSEWLGGGRLNMVAEVENRRAMKLALIAAKADVLKKRHGLTAEQARDAAAYYYTGGDAGLAVFVDELQAARKADVLKKRHGLTAEQARDAAAYYYRGGDAGLAVFTGGLQSFSRS
jgi:hypothetical protein